MKLNNELKKINSSVYNKCDLYISNFSIESEGKDYDACNFKLNELKVICRNSKITPKKVGQFVTFWKRNAKGIIAPFHKNDEFDFFVINTKLNNVLGQFVFPKSILIEKGLVSSDTKDGKRGFRIYTPYDVTASKQAIKTQKWQSNYFYKVTDVSLFEKVEKLYKH